MEKTSDIVKHIRASGLSQSEIAKRTGISQSRVSRWENGDVPVGADDALRLAALWRSIQQAPKEPANA